MLINKINLTNFRNWKEKTVELSPATVIVGRNGIGKTSIVEAIYLLGMAKSFRANNDRELLHFDQDFFRIVGEGKEDEKDINFEIRYSLENKRNKQSFFNGQEFKYSQFVGKLKTVVLSFESNRILNGTPADRRQFLDSLICQLDPEYTYNLLKLTKILKQRNHLLQNIHQGFSGRDQLDFWDEELIFLSRSITQKRQEIIKNLNPFLKEYFNQLINKNGAEIVYRPSFSQKALEDWSARREKEIILGKTLVGPHRDELLFLANDKAIADYGSRGENRSYLYALKKAELDFLKEETNQSPILLIDDCYSELDTDRQNKVWDLTIGQQTIMTTANKDYSWPNKKEFSLINLD